MSKEYTVALGVEYDGQCYHGWQDQLRPDLPTVQASVQTALSFVANHSVKVICAGRTDSGVHATAQVVSFKTLSDRPLKAWVQGVNSRLPDSISVAWAKVVSDEFHARFTATARRYQYFILNKPRRSAITAGKMTWFPRSLNTEFMHQAAQALIGEHDFTSFRGAGCQSHSAFRHVTHLSVSRVGDFVVVDIKANAFLLHMVRNIVGSLCDVGIGEQPVEWMAELLKAKDRNVAGITAPADGLYLVNVDYPEEYQIPDGYSLPFVQF